MVINGIVNGGEITKMPARQRVIKFRATTEVSLGRSGVTRGRRSKPASERAPHSAVASERLAVSSANTGTGACLTPAWSLSFWKSGTPWGSVRERRFKFLDFRQHAAKHFESEVFLVA